MTIVPPPEYGEENITKKKSAQGSRIEELRLFSGGFVPLNETPHRKAFLRGGIAGDTDHPLTGLQIPHGPSLSGDPVRVAPQLIKFTIQSCVYGIELLNIR
jgi:hypothetical protein